MSDVKFNSEQEEAIQSTGNVIVSAGAGSGKTAVLTERVKRNILGAYNNPVSLDELLILTFTNDAATSMKNKIKKALSNSEKLSYLVPFVDSAHIETFDAYSQFIVKKYGHYLGYSSNINVLDDDILYVKVANTISEALEAQYLKKSPTFEEIIFNYCVKSDKPLFEFLLNIYSDVLSKKDDPIKFLNDYKEKYLNYEYFSTLISNLNEVINGLLKEYHEHLLELNNIDVVQLFETSFAIFNGVNKIEDLIKLKDTFCTGGSLSTKYRPLLKEDSETLDYKKEIETADKINKIYKTLYAISKFQLKEYFEIDINNQIKYLTYLIDEILIPSIYKIDEFKRSTGYFTFSDIAKIAINILKSNEEIRLELKNKYKLIMIDETQDTSDSQEEFISLISNNNTFCVGDIKQSIYRFRNAKPELFKRKYDKYSANDGGRAINMNKNYRSRKEILNTINDIFSVLMHNDFGGAEYKESHLIQVGNTDFDKFGSSPDIKHGIFQLPYSSVYFDENGDYKDNVESKTKGEAAAICDNILNRIKSGYKVYDSENKCLRPCTFKDFTVLTYKGTKFSLYEEVFKKYNIPLNAVYSENLTEDISITVLINIFSFISLVSKSNLTVDEESELKHLYASILRSFLLNKSDTDLYKTFVLSENYKESEIFKELKEISNNFSNGSLTKLFETIITKLNYLPAFSRLNGCINAIDKNNIFYNKTKVMDEIGYTLNDFVLYLKSLSKFNINMEQVIYSQASNAVSLTTIHKSKGLEYPVVYLPSLGDFSAPKFTNNGDFYVLSQNYFFLPFFSDAHKETNIFKIIFENDKSLIKEDKEERLRLFYVALTRAKEDLVFVCKDKIEDYKTIYNQFLNRTKNRIEKRKVKISDREIESLASKELERYVKEHDGNNFNDFLFNAFISFDLDPYMDEEILNLDDILKERCDKKEIAKIFKNKILKYYFLNHHSLRNIDYDKLLKEAQVESSNSKINSQSRLIYKGAIIVFGQILEKVDADIFSSTNIKINFRFYAYKSITVSNINEDQLVRLSNELSENNNTFAEILLEKYFVYDSKIKQDFKEISSIKGKTIKEIHRPKVEAPKLTKASKDKDDTTDDSALLYGTHIHSLLEILDFKKPDFSFIKSDKEKTLISNAYKLLSSSFDIQSAHIFKEYQFVDEVNMHKGIIDLLLVFESKAIIVDYKLKNISDKEYVNQLSVYKKYVEEVFNMSSECYLLSILDNTLQKII